MRSGPLLLLLALAGPATAQEEPAGEPRGLVSLFVGVTDPGDGDAVTIGLDAERRLGPRVGVGALADVAFAGAERELLVAPALYVRPLARLRLDVAPGVVRGGGRTVVALRLGVDWDVELDARWSVAPNVNLDVTADRAVLVVGGELGLRF